MKNKELRLLSLANKLGDLIEDENTYKKCISNFISDKTSKNVTLEKIEKEQEMYPEKGSKKVKNNKKYVKKEFENLKKDIKENSQKYIDILIKENIQLKKIIAKKSVENNYLEKQLKVKKNE